MAKFRDDETPRNHPFTRWRRSRGLTQAQAARLAGVGIPTLAKLEQANQFPIPKNMAKITRITDGAVRVEDIINYYAKINGGTDASQMHPLKLWRLRNGISGEALAKKASYSSPCVYAIERGELIPLRTTAQKLSAATNGEVSPYEIRSQQQGHHHAQPVYHSEEEPMRTEDTPNLKRTRLTQGMWAGRTAVIANCSVHDCKRTRIYPCTNSTISPPEVYHKKLQQEGWVVRSNGRTQVCPDCRANNKAARETLSLKLGGEKTMETEAAPAAEEEEREITPADKRTIYAALQHHFDPARGLYRQGHSDATIAKGHDVPEAWVINVREEMFGELRVDKDLERAKRRLEHLNTQIKELQENDLPKLESILDRITSLERQANEIREMLPKEVVA